MITSPHPFYDDLVRELGEPGAVAPEPAAETAAAKPKAKARKKPAPRSAHIGPVKSPDAPTPA